MHKSGENPIKIHFKNYKSVGFFFDFRISSHIIKWKSYQKFDKLTANITAEKHEAKHFLFSMQVT